MSVNFKYNPVTRKMTAENVADGNGTGNDHFRTGLALDKDVADTLLGFAKADGLKVSDDNGDLTRRKAVKLYIMSALTDFITARKAADAKSQQDKSGQQDKSDQPKSQTPTEARK